MTNNMLNIYQETMGRANPSPSTKGTSILKLKLLNIQVKYQEVCIKWLFPIVRCATSSDTEDIWSSISKESCSRIPTLSKNRSEGLKEAICAKHSSPLCSPRSYKLDKIMDKNVTD